MKYPIPLNLFLAAATLAAASSAHAAAKTWTGTTDATWNTGANWGGTAPVSGDSLIFTSATGAGGLTLSDNLMTPGTFNVAGITFNSGSGAYVINPGAAGTNGFTLTGNVTNSSTSTQTINDLISMTAVRSFTTAASGGNLTLGGKISGTGGGITVLGTGVLTITGDNNYTGGTTLGLSSGAGGQVLAVGSDTALGTGTLTIAGALTGTGSATIRSADANDRIIGNAFSLGSTGIFGSSTTGNLKFTGTNATGGGAKTFTVNNAVTEFSGIVSGTTATTLTKDGVGTLVFSGNNDFTKLVSVSAGVLNIRNDNALGTTAGGTTVSSGAALELQHATGIAVGAEALSLAGTGIGNGGAMRNISGANTYGGVVTLAAAGRINSDAGSLTLTGGVTGTNQNLTVGGAGNSSISAITTGSGTLTKDGAGALTLTGNSAYTGGTTITAGKLLVNNTTGSGTGTGAVTVSSGATLGGTGIITGAVTVTGTIRGGTGATASGTLTVGNVTLASGSIIELALGAGGTHSSLNFNGTESFQADQQFSFLDLGIGAGNYDNIINGVDAGIATSGWNFQDSVWKYTFTNDGAGGMDLNVTAVPEPSTYGLLGAGALAAAALVRRRRKLAGKAA